MRQRFNAQGQNNKIAETKAALPSPFLVVCLLTLLTACGTRAPAALPTAIDIDSFATAVVLTENAPPPGFDLVAFPRIDDNLDNLPGWHYRTEVFFKGVFARTTRETSAHTVAEIWYEQVGNARRVVATIESDMQNQPDPITYEAVRLGPDTFLVRDGVCLSNAGDDADLIADLGAGNLVGGVNRAETAVQRARINGEAVWRYSFGPDSLLLPSIALGADSRYELVNGELWVAPDHNVVVRYYVTLEIENATLFGGPLPVTGTVNMRYDLYDVGTTPNISVPFGC